jgi:hypothetical protein
MEYYIYYIIPGGTSMFPLYEKIHAKTPEAASASFSKIHPGFVIKDILIVDYDNGKLKRALAKSKLEIAKKKNK